MRRSCDAVVAGAALLLDLDDSNASAVAAKAAVLARPTVARRGVRASRGFPAAAPLLMLTDLTRVRVKDLHADRIFFFWFVFYCLQLATPVSLAFKIIYIFHSSVEKVHLCLSGKSGKGPYVVAVKLSKAVRS